MRNSYHSTFLFLFVAVTLLCPLTAYSEDANRPIPPTLSGNALFPAAWLAAHDRSPISRALNTYQQRDVLYAFSKMLQTSGEIKSYVKLLDTIIESDELTLDLDYKLSEQAIQALENLVSRIQKDPDVVLEQKDLNDFRGALRQFELPARIIALDWNYRYVYGNRIDPAFSLYSQSLLYSNAPKGWDMGGQVYYGDAHGFGISARYSPLPLRSFAMERTAQNTYILDAVNWTKTKWKPNIALFGSYDNIYGSGSVVSGGMTVSYLLPTWRKRLYSTLPRSIVPPSGFLLQAAVSTTWMNANHFGAKSFVPVSASIAWQDKTPYLFEIEKSRANRLLVEKMLLELFGYKIILPGEQANLERWNLRFAFEWSRIPRFPSEGFGDSWALSLRIRDNGSGEYALTYGKTANYNSFFGLTIGSYFGGKRYH